MVEPVPCKCCGSMPDVYQYDRGIWVATCPCYGCNSVTMYLGVSIEDAIANWNENQAEGGEDNED